MVIGIVSASLVLMTGTWLVLGVAETWEAVCFSFSLLFCVCVCVVIASIVCSGIGCVVDVVFGSEKDERAGASSNLV